jgi:hypothetical protein
MAAGLPGLRIHDLRHTAVALWIAAEPSPKEVAAAPGTRRSASCWTATATCARVGCGVRDRLDLLFRGATEHGRNTAG